MNPHSRSHSRCTRSARFVCRSATAMAPHATPTHRNCSTAFVRASRRSPNSSDARLADSPPCCEPNACSFRPTRSASYVFCVDVPAGTGGSTSVALPSVTPPCEIRAKTKL